MDNGTVLYQGPSKLDGEAIVVILTGLTGDSSNSKTGAMLQTWILRVDQAPQDALRNGADFSICGDCPHRRQADGSRACYVRMQAPPTVWKAFQRGRYPTVTDPRSIAAIGRGRKVRLGSYGDPAAVPTYVWQALTLFAEGFTGYTHQVRHPGFDWALLRLCMVSADSLQQAVEAEAMGWRAFYVRPAWVPLPKGLAQCPAAAEAGRKATCAACLLCGGSSVKARSVTIQAHGSGRKYIN